MRLQSSAATTTKQSACKLENRKDNNNTKCKKRTRKKENQLMQRKASSSPTHRNLWHNWKSVRVRGDIDGFDEWMHEGDGNVDECQVRQSVVRCPGQQPLPHPPFPSPQGLRIFVNLIEFQWKLSRFDGDGDWGIGSDDAWGGSSAVLISFCLYLARRQLLPQFMGAGCYKVSSSPFLDRK